MILCILGIAITGGYESTRNNAVATSNRINDYLFVSPFATGLLFRCITGLGPSTNNNNDLGALYFNGQEIPNGQCNGPVIQARGATIRSFVGVLNAFLCRTLRESTEGSYTCTIRNSSLVYESISVGVYYTGRSEYFCDVTKVYLSLLANIHSCSSYNHKFNYCIWCQWYTTDIIMCVRRFSTR